jgi:hypothetical protein
MKHVSNQPVHSKHREYRDRHLGIFSSHPYWLERGSDWIRRLLVGTIMFLYLLAAYLWLRGHGIDRMIPAFGVWLVTDAGQSIAMIAAVATGMMAAASFQFRMALRKLSPDLARQRDRPVVFSLPTAMVIVLAGFVLPLVLTFAPNLPFEARFFGALIALTPTATLSLLLPSAKARPVTIPWLSGGVILPILIVGSFSKSAAEWVRFQLPEGFVSFFPMLGSLEGLHQFAMSLSSLSAVVFAFNLISWLRGLPEKSRCKVAALDTTSTAVKSASWWRRLLMSLGIVGSRSHAETRAKEEAELLHQQHVDWALELARQCGFTPEPPIISTPGQEDTSSICDHSTYDILFGGSRPTQDQFKALTDFKQLRRRCIEDLEAEVTGTGFEMILEGPAGSGRSSVLDAMAFITLLSQGTGSIILVSDLGRMKFATRRIGERIAALHLNPYVTVGGIEDAWNQTGRNEAPPDFCVTTPELWEQWLPGQMVRDGTDFELAKQLMAHYSTVLVDDWLDHPVEVRAHLPFMLDKHRLFLESEMVPRATVVAFPSLTETGRTLAVSRLMGDAGIIDESRQIVRLRHRPLPAATVVDVICDSVDAAIEKLASAVGQSGQPSILLRKGIDYEEAERQTLDYQNKYQNSQITVCYCGDQVQAVDGDIRAILMKAACGPEAVFALRAHRQENSIVIMRVRDRREIASSGRITPLIVDRTGRGMAESHLRNILRFVSPGSPVSRRCWGQIGLEIPAQMIECPQVRMAGTLVLDLPELLPEPERRERPYLAKLGSYISLEESFKYLERVDCHWIPDPGVPPMAETNIGQAGPSHLHLPVPDQTSQLGKGSTVLWIGNEGSELGRSQLHYAESLLLKRQRVFCPDRIREETERGLEIEAAKFRDNGADAIHPKIEMEWKCAEQDSQNFAIATGHGGPAHRFIWADLGSSAGVRVNARLIERVDDMDRPSPCFSFKFEWGARVRPLLLSPTAAVIDQQEDYLTALKSFFSASQDWGTSHPGFLPGMTYALTRGLEADLPSSEFFGKILVFRLEGKMAKFAKAVAWFVEPLGTGRTLSNAVHELLKEEAYLKQLASRMDAILRQGWEKSPCLELARFWLPRRSIEKSPITAFEKKLIKNLCDGGADQNKEKNVILTCKLECPHCTNEFEHIFHWGKGPEVVMHCDQVVQLLLTGQQYQVYTPEHMAIRNDSKILTDKPIKRQQTKQKICLSIWQIINDQIVYERDHCIDNTVPHGGDLWLHPDDLWQLKKGDCDDHATLFTEWAINNGVNAYTYMGWTDGDDDDSYHAWSVANIDGNDYLIEATGQPENELSKFHDGIGKGFWRYKIDTNKPRFSSQGLEVWENGLYRKVLTAKLVN